MSEGRSARVVVVGGGISGLTLAFRLCQVLPRVQVTVLEQHLHPGGLIGNVRREGFLVETGPNGFLDNNPATLDLARDLSLTDQLTCASEVAGRNRFLLLDGRLRLLPNSLFSFLTSDLLSWVAKVELLTERFRPGRTGYDDESIDHFARRRAGREVANTFADAFVTGILAGDPRLLSVQAAFPRLAGMERDHGSITAGMAAARRERLQTTGAAATGRARMWSFSSGMSVLIDALATALGERLKLGITARAISREGSRWRILTDGPDFEADAVVLACPAYRQAELLGDLDPGLAESIAGIAYNRIAVVALGYHREEVRHRLDGFGYLSPQRTRRDVLGVQWCSSIFPGQRAPDGIVLLRALCGGWNRPEMIDWDDTRLIAAVRREMHAVMRIDAAPVFVEVKRWERAIPQYLLGHLDRVAWVDDRVSRHPSLFLAGNAYRGVAINDCVEQAGRIAARVAQSLSPEKPAST